MPELGVKNLFSFKRLHQSSCLCLSGFLIWWESCPEELSSLRLSWINIKSDWLRGSQYLRALLWTPKLSLLPNSLLCISFHLTCWFFSSILAFECRVCQSRVQSFVGFVALLLVNSSVPMFQLSRSADVADINLQPPPLSVRTRLASLRPSHAFYLCVCMVTAEPTSSEIKLIDCHLWACEHQCSSPGSDMERGTFLIFLLLIPGLHIRLFPAPSFPSPICPVNPLFSMVSTAPMTVVAVVSFHSTGTITLYGLRVIASFALCFTLYCNPVPA